MKNLKDYVGKEYNIIFDNKEEWDAIIDLALKIDYVSPRQEYYYASNKYLTTSYNNCLTSGSLPCGIPNRTEIKASEFLPPKDSPNYEPNTYLVALKDCACYISKFKKGDIGVTYGTNEISLKDGKGYVVLKKNETEGHVKSFSTFKEAKAFAETLKPKTMTLLDEAYKRYPIGTKFISKTDYGLIREIKPYGTHDTIKFELIENNKIWCSNGLDNNKGGCSNPFLYEDGKWVEIVETPVIETSEEVDKWIGKTVRITQHYELNDEFGKIGKVLSSNTGMYYDIENVKEKYKPSQFEEVFPTTTAYFSNVNTAVQCKTQEEYDFVINKLSYNFSNSNWGIFKDETCVNLHSRGFGTADGAYNGWKIYQFEEWCKLKGYTMQIKPNVIDSNRLQLVHCKTQEQWDIVTLKLKYVWIESSRWGIYKENTCINSSSTEFGNRDFYESNYPGCNIISFEEWYSVDAVEHQYLEWVPNLGKGKCGIMVDHNFNLRTTGKMFSYSKLPEFSIREISSQEYVQYLEEQEIPHLSPTQTVFPIKVPLFLEEE